MYLRREKEPLSQRITEENELNELLRVLRPADDDETEKETGVSGTMIKFLILFESGKYVLCDEIVTDLSDNKKGEETITLAWSPLLPWGILPDH